MYDNPAEKKGHNKKNNKHNPFHDFEEVNMSYGEHIVIYLCNIQHSDTYYIYTAILDT